MSTDETDREAAFERMLRRTHGEPKMTKQEMASIAFEEAMRCRLPDGSVDMVDLLQAVGARMPNGLMVVPLSVLWEAREAAEAVRH